MKKASKEKHQETASSLVYSKSLGAIRASVFRNEKEGRAYFNVQISRRYRSADGTWHDTSVLNGESDTVLAIAVLTDVNNFLGNATSSTADESAEEV